MCDGVDPPLVTMKIIALRYGMEAACLVNPGIPVADTSDRPR